MNQHIGCGKDYKDEFIRVNTNESKQYGYMYIESRL